MRRVLFATRYTKIYGHYSRCAVECNSTHTTHDQTMLLFPTTPLAHAHNRMARALQRRMLQTVDIVFVLIFSDRQWAAHAVSPASDRGYVYPFDVSVLWLCVFVCVRSLASYSHIRWLFSIVCRAFAPAVLFVLTIRRILYGTVESLPDRRFKNISLARETTRRSTAKHSCSYTLTRVQLVSNGFKFVVALSTEQFIMRLLFSTNLMRRKVAARVFCVLGRAHCVCLATRNSDIFPGITVVCRGMSNVFGTAENMN